MKRMMILLYALMAAGLMIVAPAVAQETAEEAVVPAVTVSQAIFCAGVENREPVGASKEFPADVGRVYFWTELQTSEVPSKITHVWYLGETKMAEVSLNVNYERTRTWSYKTILPDWAGNWRVEVVNADGTMLGKYSCTVGE